MRSLKALILAGGLLAGMAGESSAQVAVSIGTPYPGGLYVGAPAYGYPAYGYGGLGYPVYPRTFAYSSGYAGYAPVVGGFPAYGYRPYYGGYGYGVYRPGFYRPFGGFGRRWR
jgi:hypothetical protein